MTKLKIGVFDSGKGGLSVANSIQRAMPDYEVVFKSDTGRVYGKMDLDDIYHYSKPVLDNLVGTGCKVIVVACNTLTTNWINRLRKELSVPLIGLEPIVRPAALVTKTGVIAVCATPRTLASDRYAHLKQEYAVGVKVLEPDCSKWAYWIDNNSLEREKVAKTIEEVIAGGADQIVLGCTHYHWIEELINEIADGRADVIQPEEAVIKRLKAVLRQLA